MITALLCRGALGISIIWSVVTQHVVPAAAKTTYADFVLPIAQER